MVLMVKTIGSEHSGVSLEDEDDDDDSVFSVSFKIIYIISGINFSTC